MATYTVSTAAMNNPNDGVNTYPNTFQSYINNAVTGDTINIPSGVFNWNPQMSFNEDTYSTGVFINKSLTITGTGPGSCQINSQNIGSSSSTAGTTTLIRSGTDGHIRLSGIYFKQTATWAATNLGDAQIAFGRSDTLPPTAGNQYTVIVTNCTFDVGSQWGYSGEIRSNGIVLSNCLFTGGVGLNGFQITCRYGTEHWNTPDTMGGVQDWTVYNGIGNGYKSNNGDGTGTPLNVGDTAQGYMGYAGLNNTYIEDCTFASWGTSGCSDVDGCARVTFRHCHITDCCLFSHGQDSSPQGARHFEVVDCDFHVSSGNPHGDNHWVAARGAVILVTGNTFDAIGGHASVNMECEMIWRATNIPNTNTLNCQTVYPANRQCGIGWSSASSATYGESPVITMDGTGAASDPIFIWNNTEGGSSTITFSRDQGTDGCGNGLLVSNFVVQNRDFYLGVARPGYVRYTYPHPLVTGKLGNPASGTLTVTGYAHATYTQGAGHPAPGTLSVTSSAFSRVTDEVRGFSDFSVIASAKNHYHSNSSTGTLVVTSSAFARVSDELKAVSHIIVTGSSAGLEHFHPAPGTFTVSGSANGHERQRSPAPGSFTVTLGTPPPGRQNERSTALGFIAINGSSNILPYAYPIKLSSNGRYFVDQNNKPFPMMCDSAWEAICYSTQAQFSALCADRASKGFNAVFFPAVIGDWSPITGSKTSDGVAPFNSGTQPSNYDITQPNPTYFNRILGFCQSCNTYGLLAVVNPMEAAGWLTYMIAFGTTKLFNYGVYIATLLSSCPNVVWLHGNDYNRIAGGDGTLPGNSSGWSVSATDACVRSIADGIKSFNPNSIQSVELGNNSNATNFGQSVSTDDTYWNPVLGFNSAYTYLPTYATAKAAWKNAVIPVVPYVLAETAYEHEPFPTQEATPLYLRKANWCTIMSGGSGIEFGVHEVSNWSWTSNPSTYLNTPGAIQVGYLKSFLSSIKWWLLVPDFSHSFLTSGFGTEFTNLAVLSTDVNGSTAPTWLYADAFVTSALSSDNTFAVAYLQSIVSVTFQMSQMSESCMAQWYDPTNNTYTTIPGGPFPNSGTKTFTPTGNNSGGDPDWVLLLSAIASNPATGSFSVTGSSSSHLTKEGHALGSLTITGSSFGRQTERSTAAGTVSITSSALSRVNTEGTATGTFVVTSSSIGSEKQRSSAPGSIVFTGTAPGQEKQRGSASGTFVVTGSAFPRIGTGSGATGTVTFSSSAISHQTERSTAAGIITFTGTASKRYGQDAGSAVGQIVFTATSTGHQTEKTTGIGSITISGVSLSRVNEEGKGVGTFTVTGSSRGRLTQGTSGAGIIFSGTASSELEIEGRATGSLVVTSSATPRGFFGIDPVNLRFHRGQETRRFRVNRS